MTTDSIPTIGGKSNAFHPISASSLAEIRAIVSEQYLLTTEQALHEHGHDETEDLVFLPEAVALPGSTEEVSAIMRVCYRERIPVTVRGAGTGLAGGALPTHGGLVMSMKRLDQILRIDERNFQVTTQPGVITEFLQNTLKEKGLFYPPDPSSRGWSFIGGNIGTNAGGPKAVKYGVVKDHVLNLEVVLPNGEVIWTGANTLKNSTGYNLTQLLVGRKRLRGGGRHFSGGRHTFRAGLYGAQRHRLGSAVRGRNAGSHSGGRRCAPADRGRRISPG